MSDACRASIEPDAPAATVVTHAKATGRVCISNLLLLVFALVGGGCTGGGVGVGVLLLFA